MAADGKAPHEESVGPGALHPSVLRAGLGLAQGLDAIQQQLDLSLLPPHGHLGAGKMCHGGSQGPTHVRSQPLTLCHWPARKRWWL